MSMKKIAVGVLAALFVGVLALAALAYAGVATIPGIQTSKGSDNNVGRHAYKVNIIGRPNNWNGDDTGSNGKVLFIGLKTNAQEVTCELGSGVGDDTGQTSDQVPDTVVSVFDASFKEYFWQISNNGLRNMQLIFVAAT